MKRAGGGGPPTARWLVLGDLLGVAVFSASGALAALGAGLDLLGVVAIASVTAIGGGTLRDLLLGRHPVFWMQDTTPLWVILVAAVATVAWTRVMPPPAQVLLVADALGLALFALSGARLAVVQGCPALVVLFMGSVTGVGGGMLRDVLTSRVPLVLRQDIYATAALAGIASYLVLRKLGVAEPAAFWVGMLLVAALRLAAVAWGWQLPHFGAA